MIEFTWDSRDLQVWRGRQVDAALTRAVSKAGGDAVRFLRTGSSRLLRQRKRMRVKTVNAGLPLHYPKTKSLEAMEWRMDVSGAPIPVIDFPSRQTKRGVSVAINTGARALIKSAFIATMRSGHTGVFKRDGKARLPISELFSSKISDVVQDRGFIPFVQEGAQTVFSNSFDRLFKIELGKLK
jgi:hypothetical protein